MAQRGYLGEFARTVTAREHEEQTTVTHVYYLTLSCGHVMRETGKQGASRNRINCGVCEAEARVRKPAGKGRQ